MEGLYPVGFINNFNEIFPKLFSNNEVILDIDPKLNLQIDCSYPYEMYADRVMATGPCKVIIKIRGNTMQKFNLKKFTDNEIVSESLEELEQIYQAIQDGEIFIFVCGSHAEVMNGSKLNTEITNGNITLSADLN